MEDDSHYYISARYPPDADAMAKRIVEVLKE